MKQFIPQYLLIVLVLIVIGCNEKKVEKKIEEEKRTVVEMVTDLGPITIELYNETPLHRDNFIKLVKERAYDSVMFHRVINTFMIQAGDPDSKNAIDIDTLGNGDVDYKIKAEFNPNLFHKKGVLAAARDGNPERASSGMQFYIAQGKVFNDSLLDKAEVRINNWLAQHEIQNATQHKYLLDSLQQAMNENKQEKYLQYQDSINIWAKSAKSFTAYTIPESHRAIYKTVGGTPHLDQNYTVYGEVVKGLNIVDSIAAVPTGQFDRPIRDVRIISMRIATQ
mgnify:CR=1 FL=1|tara:strand:- start:628 stop:1467 length:840 start_codon:yes stop_codon:yes gene_type:complete